MIICRLLKKNPSKTRRDNWNYFKFWKTSWHSNRKMEWSRMKNSSRISSSHSLRKVLRTIDSSSRISWPTWSPLRSIQRRKQTSTRNLASSSRNQSRNRSMPSSTALKILTPKSSSKTQRLSRMFSLMSTEEMRRPSGWDWSAQPRESSNSKWKRSRKNRRES